MTARYRLSPDAETDLYRIWRYGLDRWGEAAADDYVTNLFERFREIATNPEQYPAVDDIRPGYRRSVFGTDSIYYRVINGTVEIMAIIGRQDLEAWLER